MMQNELDDKCMSVRQLVDSYRRKDLSPVDVVNRVLRDIERENKRINAFCFVDVEGARNAAKKSEAAWVKGDPRGPLDGVPVTIKDVVKVRGWRTTMGSLPLANAEPSVTDSPPVARLREAGAILVGMTTTPEYGCKGVTDNLVHGITRNPWNTTTTPGGSSGGAAAAAILGLGCLHIGSDGGGSVRIPAGFTGVVGHKPSFGRIPAWPPSPYGTLSHIGPIARNVEDAAIMLNVLAGADSRDWYSLRSEERDYTQGLGQKITPLRIAYSPTLGYCTVDSEVAAAVRKVVEGLEASGIIIEEVDPGFEDPIEIFDRHWSAGAAAVLRQIPESDWENLEPTFLEIGEEGMGISLAEYQEAVEQRAMLGSLMRQFHDKYDALITPTLPITAFQAGSNTATPDQRWWTDWTPFSYPFNLTQQPACSVPCGLSAANMPIGLQIVGPMHEDQKVLKIANIVESVVGGPLILPRN